MSAGREASGGDTLARRRGLLAALVVDNLGSGMFLPLSVVFIVRSVGLPVGTAGTVLTGGTLLGLLFPALVGRVVDRVGPLAVVVWSMAAQATGMVCYLLAHGIALTVVAAALTAAGLQSFYSALFALISSVAGSGPKDRVFAAVAMARSGAFGAGSLIAAALLSLASTTGLRIAVVINVVSFVAAAALLTLLVRPKRVTTPRQHSREQRRSVRVHRDGPFLVLIVTVALLALITDVFLVGLPVYALTIVRAPAWVPGVCLAALTAATSTLTSLVIRKTTRLRRTTALSIGAGFFLVWGVSTAITAGLPASWAGPWLLGSTVLLIVGSLFADTRANAIAEAAAPTESRGHYLATFQYAFAGAGLLAPLVVALFAVSSWLPWVVAATCAAIAIGAIPWLGRALPSQAINIDSARVQTETRPSSC